jgi:hypothetical protein
MKIKSFLFSIIIFSFISSCAGFYKPITLDMKIPDGPENYQAGWYAGCRSAIGSMPSFTNSMVYDVTFANGQYQDDPVFQEGWNSAFYSCAIHTGTFAGMGWEHGGSIRNVIQ